jgi:plasmid stabilization system protein ParE
MTKPVRFERNAEQELRDAITWYERFHLVGCARPTHPN